MKLPSSNQSVLSVPAATCVQRLLCPVSEDAEAFFFFLSESVPDRPGSPSETPLHETL